MKKITILIAVLLIAVLLGSCSVYNAFTNAQRLKFKLGSVQGFNLAGVNIANISSINNISALDILKLTSAFAKKEMPTAFTLNVLAKNPNDGTGGTKESSALIKNLDWRLLIDSKETINGAVQNINVPGVGQETTIPVGISLDLFKFFNDKGYEDIVNLALAIGGQGGSASRLALKVVPTVETFLGPITYPGEITVIDKEFRDQ